MGVFDDDDELDEIVNAGVMEQGRSYQGPDLGGPSQGAETSDDGGGARAPRQRRERPERPQKEPMDPDLKKKLLIGVGIGVVVIGIGLFLGITGAEKKRQEELERAEALLQEQEEVVFKYTSEEIEALREVGFTGYEIEEFEFMEYDAMTIVEEEKAKRQAALDAEILPYFDKMSDEFKELYSKTWVGQPDVEVGSDLTNFSYRQENLNLDYEKLPARGHQLFLKVYINANNVFFMDVTPERWNTLKDSGNIVVQVSYTIMDNGSYIITDVQEIVN